jgi:hypothetical protein
MSVPTFQVGTILVEAGTSLPGAVLLQPSALSGTWKSVVDLDRAGLAAEVSKAGWTFFYMAGELTARAFGSSEDHRVRTAIGRVIEGVQAQKCNTVEITHLAHKSFLGIPYVSITAHARHLQDGVQFRGR